MEKQVFSPSFGNVPSRMIGREQVLEAFLRGLDGAPGNRDRAMLLLGQRGYGKTVLLLEMAERARTHGFVAASPTTVSGTMLDKIIEKVQDEGEQYVKQEKKTFSYKLTHLCNALNKQGKGVLVLVDEVQASTPELKELVITYQELVGAGANIAMAMAGLPGAISEVLNDKVLTFLNRARKIDLEPLRIAEIEAYYRQSFQKLGIAVGDAMLGRAASATEGSPYMLQLIGYYITQKANRGKLTEKAFQSALLKAQEDFLNDICKTTCKSLSETDMRFLRAMLPDKTESLTSDIAKRMGVSADFAQQYRRRLLDAGIITSVRRGVVAFDIPYLAEFLKTY